MAASRALLDDDFDLLTADPGHPHRATRAISARRALLDAAPVRSHAASSWYELDAAPRRCQARRALAEPIVVIEPTTTEATVPNAEKTATLPLPIVDLDEAASTAAFVRRRTRRLRNTLGVVGAAALISFTGWGISVHTVAANEQPAPPAVSSTAEPTASASLAPHSTAVSRDVTRPAPDAETTTASANETAVANAAPEPSAAPIAVITPTKPTIEGIYAPGQASANTVEQAIAQAKSMVGNHNYGNMCLSLVARFYGYSSAGEVGAQQAAATVTAAGQMHTDMSNIPVGALIWYDGTPIGNPYGHVAMYAGDGMVYSNGAPTGVGLIPLNEPASGWGEPVIGWSAAWLPAATK